MAPEGHEGESSEAILKCWHFLVFCWEKIKNDLQSLECVCFQETEM